MKIKVATTFSFRSESKEGQGGERFVSSALTIEPDDPTEISDEGCCCGTDRERIDNQCPGREICCGNLNEKNTKESSVKQIPRFMIIGMPCTGKTTLAKQLCKQFGCELVNASDLVEYHLTRPTEYGIIIDEVMRSGNDLADELVLEILRAKLNSKECLENGYVIDGIPTHSEHTMTIEEQLHCLFNMENGPEYLIDIQISDDALRTRWEEMRIDFLDGKMYARESYESVDSHGRPKSPSLRYFGHPDFPRITEATKNRLLTRHEELPESLDKHFEFYKNKVSGQLNDFVSKFDPNAVISLDGHVSPTERFQETLKKLGKIPDQAVAAAPSIDIDQDLMRTLTEGLEAFGEEPPRIVFLGKPCTGKTTIAHMLCQAWGCRYVNASDLISRHIQERSGRGMEILSAMQQGHDLPDITVFNIINEELQSPECRQTGYILDNLPSYSEKLLNIDTQLEYLARIYPAPKFWVLFDLPDKLLKERWEAVRIDHGTGRLYSQLSYDEFAEPTGRCDFPLVDEETKSRLLTRHEELPENLEQHFTFYNEHVSGPLEEFLSRLPPSSVIRLDTSSCPGDICKDLICKMRGVSRNESRSKGPLAKSFEEEPPRVPAFLVDSRSIWGNNPPRLILVGKPCTGKTTLARLLSRAWNCKFVNASELVSQHIKDQTARGIEILDILQDGQDLPDCLVFDIVKEVLQSQDCRQSGYILEGLPTHSEKLLDIQSQFEFLDLVYPAPYFWVHIDLSDPALRSRWETVRIDYATGLLYSSMSYDALAEPSGRCDFPVMDEETKDRLLTRHEELPENLEKHFQFYNDHLAGQLQQFLQKSKPESVITLDAHLCPEEMALRLIEEIQHRITQLSSSSRPGSPEQTSYGCTIDEPTDSSCYIRIRKRSTADTQPDNVLPKTEDRSPVPEFPAEKLPVDSATDSTCCCQCGAQLKEQAAQIWRNGPPRFLLIGKPCTGKTALAKLMCSTWGCELVNATELIQDHLDQDDSYGRQLKELLFSGKDLNDSLVMDIMANKLRSPECREHGFVVDDFPTYSEKSLSVQKQLDFLSSLDPGPNYVIDLQMPDDLLRARWEAVKIDLQSGILYVDQTHGPQTRRSQYPPSCCLFGCKKAKGTPPRKSLLITRHEELAESMEANIAFYHEVVEPQLRIWVERNYADRTIPMDGDLTTNEIFLILQQKLLMMASNPNCPPRQLFTDKGNSFLPGSCCRRCGARYSNLEPLPDLWSEFAPRFIIFGKPCTGKTSLARKMCAMWNCQLVNASELIQHHLSMNTPTGQKIREILSSGQDLSDQFVINMLNEKLCSPACIESGYVLDGIPTHSEKSKSIECQMEFLESLDPPPEYVIYIRISDADLRSRWEAVRIDVSDGTLYTSQMFGHKVSHPGQPDGLVTRHADFPEIDDETKNRLITRHEELPENLDKHFPFYHLYISPHVQRFIETHDKTKVIPLNGEHSPTKMLNTLLYKLHVMASNPNVPTSELFPDDEVEEEKNKAIPECECRKHGINEIQTLEDLWLDKPPRVVIFGKPCTGKTSLAKRLCSVWGCELINASEMVAKELKSGSKLGREIRQTLASGSDLSDDLVCSLMCSLIQSPKCVQAGYVLDGFPTHSELKMTIESQLELLRSLENGPEYIIEVKMSDAELRERWEAIRIDVADGVLYSKQNYSDVTCAYGAGKPSCSGRRTHHPDFPVVDESVKDRLLTRHEELPENLDRHFSFYHQRLEEPIKRFVKSHDPAAVVKVKGNVSPTQLFQSVLVRLSLMAQHPGVPTAILFRSDSDSSQISEPSNCTCKCSERDTISSIGTGLWRDTLPQVVVIGNSCSGKTTLAKRLAKDWNCVFVNATELINQHLCSRTALGDQIRETMCVGQDLSDDLVLDMLREKLSSEECMKSGYVLDDYPTSSEKGMRISQQLEMLLALPAPPEYFIEIEINEDELRNRWETIRIDLADGALYPEKTVLPSQGEPQTHPLFPTPKENIRQRLITRHEELNENIDKQSAFYNMYVRPQIYEFLNRYYSEGVIHVDGKESVADIYRVIVNTIRSQQKKSTFL